MVASPIVVFTTLLFSTAERSTTLTLLAFPVCIVLLVTVEFEMMVLVMLLMEVVESRR